MLGCTPDSRMAHILPCTTQSENQGDQVNEEAHQHHQHASGDKATDTADEPGRTVSGLSLRQVGLFYALGALFLGMFALLWHAGNVLLLVFASILIAVLLHGASVRLGRLLHLSYRFALPLVLLLVIAVIGLTGTLLAPQVAEQIDQLFATIPSAIQKLRGYVERYGWLRGLANELPSPEKMASAASTMLSQARLVFTGALGVLANLVIILFLSLYLAAQPQVYRRGLLALVPKRMLPRGEEVMQELGDTLWLWLFGKMLAMVVVGAGTALGLTLLDVPLALTLGIVAGLFDFIPYIGPILAGIPATLIAFTDSPTLALYVVLLFVAIQMVEAYLLTPLVERKTVSLPPALTITTQVLMSIPFGLLGVALASPLAAVVYVLVTMLYVQGVLGKHVQTPSEK
jgi:predicted PurR-regulated permease PerM